MTEESHLSQSYPPTPEKYFEDNISNISNNYKKNSRTTNASSESDEEIPIADRASLQFKKPNIVDETFYERRENEQREWLFGKKRKNPDDSPTLDEKKSKIAVKLESEVDNSLLSKLTCPSSTKIDINIRLTFYKSIKSSLSETIAKDDSSNTKLNMWDALNASYLTKSQKTNVIDIASITIEAGVFLKSCTTNFYHNIAVHKLKDAKLCALGKYSISNEVWQALVFAIKNID